MTAEAWMTISTGVLAGATSLLAFLTFRLELAWKKSSSQQLGVQTWLNVQSRFDSKEMKRCRKKLAQQLDPYKQAEHDKTAEELFDLFEDIGTLYDLKLLNRELAESAFSFYVNYWWRAAKSYIDRERMLHGDDDTLFEDFEKLAKAWRHFDPEISDEKLKKFLEDEKHLRVD
jgi:hypothetical protein